MWNSIVFTGIWKNKMAYVYVRRQAKHSNVHVFACTVFQKMAWDTCIYVALAVIVSVIFAPANAAFSKWNNCYDILLFTHPA